MEYYLFVTNECNLGCAYCSVLIDCQKHNLPLEPTYSVKTLKKFIDATQISKNSDVADVVFFGGEPTLNLPFIQKVMDGLGKGNNNYTIRYMLHTNGLLLSKIPITILDRIDTIMLSVNYTEIPQHNLNQGYFQTIVTGIRYVKNIKSLPIIGRFTITENTSLFSSVSLMHHFFDYVYWQIENCSAFDNFNEFSASYKFDLQNLLNMWHSFLKKGVKLNFIPFLACINFIVDNTSPIAFNCGYNESMVYIQTDGSCYTCCEDITSNLNVVGHIEKELSFAEFSLNDTICQSCEYISICLGRCGRMHKDFPAERIKEYCALNKTLFDYIIENKLEILRICEEKELNIGLDEKVALYTEYTP